MNQLLGRLLVLASIGVALYPIDSRAETLDDAWRTALGNDQWLQAGRSRVSAAADELAAARSGRLPSLTASAGLNRFDEAPSFDFSGAGVPATLPLFDGETMETADARVTMPLYAGGRIRYGIDAAQAMLDAQSARSMADEQQVKLDVARRFIDVLRAERALAVADSTVASLRAHVADVDDMFRAGAVARNDYLSAAVSLADAEQRRLQSRNALDLASAAYNRALGRPLDAPVTLDEQLPAIDISLDLTSPDALTAVALMERDEIDGIESAAAAYRAQSKSMRGGILPQLAVTGGYVSMPNEFLNRDDFWMVGIGVQWKLFDGGQTRRQADALNSRAYALTHEQAHFESLVALEVRQAWLRLEETRERKRLAERAVEQAEENLRVVRDRYRNGEGTNTEVLDAETLRRISHSNFDNADFDASLALYELARGVGRL